MKKELQDYVWQKCGLPKEFKEEVKFEYHRVATKATKDEYDLGFMHAHEGMFGIHNLTSDAEGEDMLTVKASTVKDIYNSMNKAHPKENAWVVKQTLEALFGSKCLPDNVDSLDSNVDSLHGNVDSLEHLEPKANSDYTPIPEKTVISKWDKTEPKPAEPKFKVGDRVVYLNYPHVWRLVTAIMEDGNYVLDGAIYDVKEFDLEPYTEPKEKTSEKRVENEQERVGIFDTILKDSFSKDRRLNIAAMMAQAILTRIDDTPQVIAGVAFRHADMLIAEAEKGGSK